MGGKLWTALEYETIKNCHEIVSKQSIPAECAEVWKRCISNRWSARRDANWRTEEQRQNKRLTAVLDDVSDRGNDTALHTDPAQSCWVTSNENLHH